MNPYNLEHIFSFKGIATAAPELIGPSPDGTKINFCNGGGEISGPKLRGTLHAFGGDWVTLRKDGVAVMDARVTFETHDGALILATYPGICDFGEGGHDRFLRGDLPKAIPMRIAPRFTTSHPDYLWLTRLFCMGIGEFRPAERTAAYDVYAVR